MFSSFSPSAETHRLVIQHHLNLTIRPVEHTASSRRFADCSAGVVHPTHHVCCNATCGLCGGHGCSSRPGGPRQCCMPAILRTGRVCESQADVACILRGSRQELHDHNLSSQPLRPHVEPPPPPASKAVSKANRSSPVNLTGDEPPPPPASKAVSKANRSSPVNLTGTVCEACEYGVDLRCHAFRMGPFHRVHDCLLPYLHNLDTYVHESNKSRVCLIGGPRSVLPFVQPILAGILSFHDPNSPSPINRWPNVTEGHEVCRLIDARTPCTSGIRILPQLPRYPPAHHRPNQLLLRHYLNRLVPAHATLGHVVMIIRTGTRQFGAVPAAKAGFLNNDGLRQRLGAGRRDVINYFGNESVLDTIRMFAGAVAVAGYHGAGVVNAVFIPHRACVTEVSTFRDANHTMTWRTNGGPVNAWNPWLRWKVHKLPFHDMLEANGVEFNATIPRDRDHWVKGLQFVGMRAASAERLAADLHACADSIGGVVPSDDAPFLGLSNEELMANHSVD